jgi:hypothetical protein
MMQSSAPSRQHRFRYDCSEQCRHGKRPLWSMPSSRRLLCKADILYVDEAPTPPLAQHELGERDLAHASSQATYFATALPAKKGPGRRGEVSAGAQRLRWNFSVSVPSWRQTNAVGRVRSFFML